ELVRLARESFHKVFKRGTPYRATGAVLMDLGPERSLQLDLFGSVASAEKWKPVYATVDGLDERFGKHTVYLGSTWKAMHTKAHENERGDAPARAKELLRGENARQRIGIPMLGDVT
ncbi:MAG TPA: hypothetical protein VFS75_00980, partial [Candidatus Paceibacterota bacterium]|nr:hypothetical protein [Candidatus Paceibacterota bacterium]